MGIDLRNEELISLFQDIDTDKSGYVDIDELTYFMLNNNENVSAGTAAAMMNVRENKLYSMLIMNKISLFSTPIFLRFVAVKNLA